MGGCGLESCNSRLTVGGLLRTLSTSTFHKIRDFLNNWAILNLRRSAVSAQWRHSVCLLRVWRVPRDMNCDLQLCSHSVDNNRSSCPTQRVVPYTLSFNNYKFCAIIVLSVFRYSQCKQPLFSKRALTNWVVFPSRQGLNFFIIIYLHCFRIHNFRYRIMRSSITKI
jgi:hypothetical protein